MPLFIRDRCGWACNMSSPPTAPLPALASSPGSGGGMGAATEECSKGRACPCPSYIKRLGPWSGALSLVHTAALDFGKKRVLLSGSVAHSCAAFGAKLSVLLSLVVSSVKWKCACLSAF